MISPTMAVAAPGSVRSERAQHAYDARLRRAYALILDMLLMAAITYAVNNVYGVTQVTSGIPGSSSYTTSTEVDWPWLTLLGVAYFMLPEALFGATPGKFLARLRVVRVDGQGLDLRALLIRNLLKPIDFLPAFYLLGGLCVLATANSQRLGDLAAGTTVVYQHRALEPGATRTATRAASRALIAALLAVALFTMAFYYFGRPPLVIEGLFNQHQLLRPDVTSYSIGSPSWAQWQVTYPFTFGTATQACTGTMKLHWEIHGWQLTDATYRCSSGP